MLYPSVVETVRNGSDVMSAARLREILDMSSGSHARPYGAVHPTPTDEDYRRILSSLSRSEAPSC